MLERGWGTPNGHADPGGAMRHHRRAADQGNVHSLLIIGDAHYYGRATAERDRKKAAAVYTQARIRTGVVVPIRISWYSAFLVFLLLKQKRQQQCDIAISLHDRNPSPGLQLIIRIYPPPVSALVSASVRSGNRRRPSAARRHTSTSG